MCPAGLFPVQQTDAPWRCLHEPDQEYEKQQPCSSSHQSVEPGYQAHSYAGYEDEFREFMVEAGIPVEKELPPKKDEE